MRTEPSTPRRTAIEMSLARASPRGSDVQGPPWGPALIGMTALIFLRLLG